MAKYKLKKTIVIGDKTIEELEIREEVTAGDLRGVKIGKDGKMDIDSMLTILSRLSATPPSIIDKISSIDTFELLEKVGNFMFPSQKTGKTQ